VCERFPLHIERFVKHKQVALNRSKHCEKIGDAEEGVGAVNPVHAQLRDLRNGAGIKICKRQWNLCAGQEKIGDQQTDDEVMLELSVNDLYTKAN